MEQKAVVLQNKGMLRDLSISKQNNEFAYENFNIRILARDHDTLLSVTNERGNRKLELVSEADKTTPFSLEGTLIGYSVLNSWLVMFTTDSAHDHIYRVKYNAYEEPEWTCMELFRGNLGFDVEHPIETLAFYESEDIQKVYWVDGLNQPRLINIKGSESTIVSGELYTKFDFVTSYDNSSFHADITRGNEGVSMPSGTRQYYVTYYNKYGQETHFIWQSPLLYSSFTDRGVSPEESTYTSFRLEFTGLDTSFDYIRVYALTWTSLSTQPQADIVGEALINESGKASFTDTGVSLASIDPASVLYLGGDMISAGTISQKDNTLFLGDIRDKALTKIEDMKEKIGNSCFKFNDGEKEFKDGVTWESKVIEFKRASDAGVEKTPYVEPTGQYPFNLQLQYPSSEIKGFKRGEKYRFAVRFVSKEGLRTQAFWIGDKENDLVPVMDSSGIDRIIAVCNLPEDVIRYASDAGYSEVELLMAQTSVSDRSILCQGVVCPTLFNLEQRVDDQPFSLSSWIMRPRNGLIPSTHFQPLKDSADFYAEIQNNYYERVDLDDENKTTKVPEPFYDNEYKSNKTVIGFKYQLIIVKRNTFFNACWYNLNIKFLYNIGGKEQTDDNHISRGCSARSEWDAYNHLLSSWESLGLPSFLCISWTTFDDLYKNIAPGLLNDSSTTYYITNVTYKDIDLSDKDLSEIIEEILKHNKEAEIEWTEDTIDSFYKFGISQNNLGKKYSSENSEYFFVDESIVTVNSPDIKNNLYIIDDNPSIKFKIVGIAPITANNTGYTMDVTPGKALNSQVIEHDFSSKNLSAESDGLVSYPLWFDQEADESNPSAPQKNYMVYLWNKTGSIIGDTSENRYATLNKKLFANLRFSYATVYCNNDTAIPDYALEDLRVYNSDSPSLLKISTYGLNKTYQGNYDRLINRPLETELEESSEKGYKTYPIFTVNSNGEDPEGNISENIFEEGKKVTDPVNIKFKSPLHAVLCLGKDGNNSQCILPYMYDYEKVNQISNSVYLPWIDYDIVNSSENNISIWSNSNYYYISDIISESRVDKIYNASLQNTVDLPEFSLYTDGNDIYGFLEDNTIISIRYGSNPEGYVKKGAGVNLLQYSIYDDGHVEIHLSFLGNMIIKRVAKIRSTFTVTKNPFVYEYDVEQPAEGNYKDAVYNFNTGHIEIAATSSLTIEIFDSEGSSLFSYISKTENEDESVFTEYADHKDLNVGEGMAAQHSILAVEIVDAPIKSIEDVFKSEGTYNLNDYNSGSVYSCHVTEDNQLGEIGTVNNTHYVLSQNYLDPAFLVKGNIGFDLKNYPYIFIGELFRSFGTGKDDTRYGGINEAALENNTFISCSETTPLGKTLYGLEGDTYVQRYDFIKTMPMTDEDENQVLDITSVMLETHENLDGRYDNQRTSNPVNINYNEFNKINPVYSQQNSFIPSTVLDEKYDLSYYPSQIAWSEEKVFNEEIDTWTGIHLISSLQLDGDKGPVRAIRRFRNSLIAFQDKGICEILFNSRTQLSTVEGVPIEIANSGKVDGKRYVTDKSGCINKWSIVETPGGIYFIDNINSSISLFNGSVQSLSDIKGFKNWIGNKNRTSIWNSQNFDNFVTFWDRVNDDIYFIGKKSDEAYNTLCYNETLQQFTSFFNYGEVPMMVNVQDRFLAYRDGNLWLQNEGTYSTNLFGEAQDFHVLYRVTPDPYGDKIFSSIEYRADMFNTPDNHYEGTLTDHTFDTLNVWNEYQDNEVHPLFNMKDSYPDVRRKFRIWRMDMPRDRKHEENPYGLNRMRNPWLYVKLTKHYDNDSPDERMVLHDVTVRYFE